MRDATKFYDMAMLAEASYVLFNEINYSIVDKVEEALKPKAKLNGTFTATQAADFVEHWEVLSHQANTDESGFSATLFKNKQTGKYVYSCRGTEPGELYSDLLSADLGDIVTDGLAIKQIVDMYNDWQRLNSAGGAAYQVAQLDFLSEETALLAASRLLPGEPSPYEALLRERSDIIIDDPFGRVYTISTENWAHEVYDADDDRRYGAGVDFGDAQPTVVGHSLGGHLAAAFTRLFPGEAVSINGAGFMTGLVEGLSGNAATNIANLFGMLGGMYPVSTGFHPDNILNLYGEKGLEATTMDNFLSLEQPGSNHGIFIEDGLGETMGHGKEQMTDSLAVYDLFIRLDERFQTASPTEVFSTLTPIFEAANNQKLGSFESLVSLLEHLFVGNYPPLTQAQWGDREALYERIIAIRNALPAQGLLVTPLTDLTAEQLTQLAGDSSDDGLVYRYALTHLNPFIITGDASLYTQHNPNGELDLYDPATGLGELNAEYLADRAEMLYWKLQVATAGAAAIEFSPYTGDGIPEVAFHDFVAGQSFYLGDPDTGWNYNRKQVYFGGKGDDTLAGYNKADRLYGNDGHDVISGGGDADYLEGGNGQDTLNGGAGDDTFYVQGTDAAYDTFNGGADFDKITGSVGDDTIRVHHFSETNSIEQIDGGEGNDTIAGTDMADSIDLSATTVTGIEQVDGGAGNDRIVGTQGSDHLIGGADNDILQGGKGDDLLEGGTGVDTYIINSGDGQDTIIDTGQNILIIDGKNINGVFEQISDTSSYRFVSTDDNFTLTFNSPGTLQLDPDNSITFQNQTSAEDFSGGDFGFFLADDQTSPTTQLTGTEGSNYLYAGLTPSLIDGQDGKDMLFGSAGEDEIIGGEGDDWIAGKGGVDTIAGGGGNDLITWFEGGSRVNAGDGDDIVVAGAREWIYLDQPKDPITADAIWADISQYWLIGHGDGVQVTDTGYLLGLFGDGIERDVTFSGDSVIGEDWSFEFSLTSDGVFNLSYFHPTLAPEGFLPVEYIKHSLSTGHLYTEGIMLWGEEGNDLLAGNAGADYLSGGTENDVLLGNQGNDLIDGGEGDDKLVGGAGDDTLLGDRGNDILIGESGADVLFGGDGDDLMWGRSYTDTLMDLDEGDVLDGGAGNDQLIGNEGNDILYGGEGNDRIWGDVGDDFLAGDAGNDILMAGEGDDVLAGDDGDDELFGEAGNDLLSGGAGVDYLAGGAGDDTYSFKPGDGYSATEVIDSIDDTKGNNILVFDAAINVNDLQLSFAGGNDLSLRYTATDSLYVFDGLLGHTNTLQIGDQQLFLSELISNTLTADLQVEGGEENDLLYGGSGYDTLIGGAGDDLLVGGAGVDTLMGGEGNDSYLINLGDSPIRMFSTDPVETVMDTAGENEIVFGDDISVTEIVTASTVENDLYLSINGTDLILVRGGFEGAIQRYSFSNGEQLDWRQLVADTCITPLNIAESAAGADLFGGIAGDVLTATGGGSTFDGGRGNDILTGAGGNNTYLFSAGDGTDRIHDVGGQTDPEGNPTPNRLRFGAGIAPDDLTLSLSSGFLQIQVGAAANDAIFIDNFTADNVYGEKAIDLFEFADGTVLAYEQLLERGFAIDGSDGQDVLTGTNIDDRISGGGGDDTLLGGAGDDVLRGGNGNDTYVFGKASGTVIIDDGATTSATSYADRISFVDGIAPDELHLVYDGQDMQVSVAGISGTLTIKDWINNRIESFDFDSGAVWDALTIESLTEDASPPSDVTPPYLLTIDASVQEDTQNGIPLSITTERSGFGEVIEEIRISGLPDGAVLNRGTDHGDGVWSLTPDQLNQLSLTPPADFSGEIQLTILSQARDMAGQTATTTSPLIVSVDPVADDAIIHATPVFGVTASEMPLLIEVQPGDVSETIGDIRLFGIPSNVALSAGSFSPEGSWLLSTADLQNLRILFPEGWNGIFNLKIDVESVETNGDSRWISAEVPIGNEPVATVTLAVSGITIGTDSNDVIIGDAGANRISGGSGHDWLVGGDGNDSIWMGQGYDYTSGGNGNDTYTVGRGEGVKIIEDAASDGGSSGADILRFYQGPDKTKVYRQDDDLIIESLVNEDKAIVRNHFSADGLNRIETIVLLAEDDPYGKYFNAATIVGDGIHPVYHVPTLILDGAVCADDNSVKLPIILQPAAASDTLLDITISGLPDGAALSAGSCNVDGLWTVSVHDLAGLSLLLADPLADPFELGIVASSREAGGAIRYTSGILNILPAGSSLGTATDDSLLAGDADDILAGLSGNDHISGGAGDDYLFGGLGDDEIHGNHGNDFLDGGQGIDVLIGGAGDDTYLLRDKADTIVEAVGDGGVDTIVVDFDLDLNALSSAQGIERVQSTGKVLTRITGNDRDNVLLGSDAKDMLWGRDGDDQIHGGGGDDVLYGDVGSDYMVGGDGNDTYDFGHSLHPDRDVINDRCEDLFSSKADLITVEYTRRIENFSANRDGDDLLLSEIGGPNELRLEDWFVDEYARVEYLQTWDGPTGGGFDASQGQWILTPLADLVSEADWNLAADSLNLRVRSVSGSEDNAIALTIEIETLDPGETIESITIQGLPGGFSLNHGFDLGGGNWALDVNDISGLTLLPDPNWSGPVDLQIAAVSRDGSNTRTTTRDFNVEVLAQANSPLLTLEESYRGCVPGETVALNIEVHLADLYETLTPVTISGVREGVALSAGTDLGEGIWSLSVEDLSGLTLSIPEELRGEILLKVSVGSKETDGQVAYSEDYFELWIDDTIAGTAGDDMITGSNFDDSLEGYGGDDTLIGNAGDDDLCGGEGNDTYIFNIADGYDYIEEESGIDTVQFGPGILLSDLSGYLYVNEERDYGYLEIYTPDEGVIEIEDWTSVESFCFDDGTTYTLNQWLVSLNLVENSAPFLANTVDLGDMDEDGNLLITASQLLATATDVDGDPLNITSLTAEHGTVTSNNDGTWIYQPDADVNGLVNFSYLVSDTVESISGSATLNILAVNDAPFVLSPLADQVSRQDIPFNFEVPAGTFGDLDSGDSLSYSATMGDGSPLPSWLSFTAATGTFSGTPGNDDGGSMEVRVTATDVGGLFADEVFTLNIESTATVPVVAGTDSGDSLRGSSSADIIYGYDGDDTLKGRSGDDTLVGGAGFDTLTGGAGDDTFIVEGDDGSYDRFNGGGGFDRIVGGVGDDTIRLNRFNGKYTVEVIDGGAGHNIIAGGQATSDTLNFGKTTLLNISHIDAGSLNDTVTGSTGDDVIIGGTGNDRLDGSSGDDTFLFNLGDGMDALNDSSGNDSIQFGVDVDKDGIVFLNTGNKLNIGYGIEDAIVLSNYSDSAIGNRIEKFTLATGEYLTDVDINQIIQEMAAYATTEGISLKNMDDVRQHEPLMTMIASSWHQA